MSETDTFLPGFLSIPRRLEMLRDFARITVVPSGMTVKTTRSFAFKPIAFLTSAGMVICPLLVTAASVTEITSPYKEPDCKAIHLDWQPHNQMTTRSYPNIRKYSRY